MRGRARGMSGERKIAMFDIRKLIFFQEGNDFTGSRTEGNRLLRYRVNPDQENQRLLAWCWREDKCFERAGEKAERDFPLSEEGLEALLAWLEENWGEV